MFFKPLRPVAVAITSLGVFMLPAPSLAQDPNQLIQNMIQLMQKAQQKARERPPAEQKQRTPAAQSTTSTPQPFVQYEVAGFRLGEQVLGKAGFREFNCKPSDLDSSLSFCMRTQREAHLRGQFAKTTSLLTSRNGEAFYITCFRASDPVVMA